MAKRKYIFLLVAFGISIVHLTGCGRSSGFGSNPIENIAVFDREGEEDTMAEEGEDTAILLAENPGETEGQDETENQGKSGNKDEAESNGKSGNQDETESLNGAESQGETKNQGGTKEESEQEESRNEADNTPKEAPQLPSTGKRLEDFVPEGWEVMDSVQLDFNGDAIPDYVGVLEAVSIDMEGYRMYTDYPRILFAIASDGSDGYRLDFQDVNLIRTRSEGGVFGDPYLPLTAEGESFTTHTYGGSAWRWSEDNTYTYREGIWWLALSEETYGYGGYTTSYSKDDWESGVGIRKRRSSEFSDMEGNWESEEYDVVYELTLDEPLTLEQAGKRWWLAPERVTDWEVEKIVFGEDTRLSEEIDLSEDMELPESMVKLPDEAYVDYCDEDCVLYTFNCNQNTDESAYCLAMYRWQDKVLSVLAKEETAIDYPEVYKGKIYYSTDIVENVSYKEMQDGVEQITEEVDTVGVRLIRMNLDGTGKETVFEYRYQENTDGITGSRIPYLSLIYEINGDEIVAEVYIGNEPHPFYRMKTDGSGQKMIGQMPKE